MAVLTDVDECSKVDQEDGSGPLCSQMCVNTIGSYYCSCYSAYKLQLDSRTCLCEYSLCAIKLILKWMITSPHWIMNIFSSCPVSCNDHIFNKHEGRLYSPRYSHPSPHNLYCTHVISMEDHFTVTLNFTDFHVHSEDGLHCLHHWLQVQKCFSQRLWYNKYMCQNVQPSRRPSQTESRWYCAEEGVLVW